MNTESQQQIAQEAADEIYESDDLAHDIPLRHRPNIIKAILSAMRKQGVAVILKHIERATEGKQYIEGFKQGWLRACVFYVDIDAELPNHDCSKQLAIRLKELSAQPQRSKALGVGRDFAVEQRSEQAFDAKCERGELDEIMRETTADYNEGRASEIPPYAQPQRSEKEWTPDKIKKIRQKATEKRNNPQDGDLAVSDAINAALMTDKETIARLESELTAERQRREEESARFVKLTAIHQEQLAAERQRAVDILNDKVLKFERLEHQLLSELAAIEQVVKHAERDFEDAPYQIDSLYFDKLQNVDLSLLHEHDKVERQRGTDEERQRWQGVHADFIRSVEARERWKQTALCALAAIEKHNNDPMADDCPVIEVDLSLLHEHDAEVLQMAERRARLAFLGSNNNDFELLAKIETAINASADALAKVKQ